MGPDGTVRQLPLFEPPEEWRHQRNQAKRELRQIGRQRVAAKNRKEITHTDLRNHELQIDHSRKIEDALHSKFTSVELFGIMVGRSRRVYRQLYRLAFEVSKAAERCWQYERGSDTSFIKYGAWDSSTQGLLAGEQLYLQLKQMERVDLDRQFKEFEITKQITRGCSFCL
jgi:Tc toxin complex TcA C-terminal TcB-binding domain